MGVPCNAARKTAPVVAFSISPEDYQSGRYYVVLVFTDRKTMLEYEHEEVKRAGRFEGLCDCLTGYEWCHRPRMDALPIGNILLPPPLAHALPRRPRDSPRGLRLRPLGRHETRPDGWIPP